MGVFTEGYLTDEVLLSTMPNGQTALDVALKKILLFEPKVTTIALAKELIKRNKYDLLKNVDGTILKEEIFPNKTLFCIKSTAARRHPNCIIRASTR